MMKMILISLMKTMTLLHLLRMIVQMARLTLMSSKTQMRRTNLKRRHLVSKWQTKMVMSTPRMISIQRTNLQRRHLAIKWQTKMVISTPRMISIQRTNLQRRHLASKQLTLMAISTPRMLSIQRTNPQILHRVMILMIRISSYKLISRIDTSHRQFFLKILTSRKTSCKSYKLS